VHKADQNAGGDGEQATKSMDWEGRACLVREVADGSPGLSGLRICRVWAS
jgi:hypothetical protein